jgi:hypothetical protein
MVTALSVVVLKQVPLECESIAQNVGYALHQRHLRSHHRHVTSHPLSELVDTVIQQETLYTIVRADNVGQVGPVSRTSSLPPDESAAEVALVLPGAVFRLCCAAGGPCAPSPSMLPSLQTKGEAMAAIAIPGLSRASTVAALWMYHGPWVEGQARSMRSFHSVA